MIQRIETIVLLTCLSLVDQVSDEVGEVMVMAETSEAERKRVESCERERKQTSDRRSTRHTCGEGHERMGLGSYECSELHDE